MNFDFGTILTRAAQITWQQKTLWVISAVPVFLSLLLLPVFIAPGIVLASDSAPSQRTTTLIVLAIFAASIVLTLITLVLGAICSAAVTLGVVRAERGSGATNFMILLRDSLAYFRRVIAAIMIINLALGAVLAALSLVALGVIAVTFGFGVICVQPMFLLLAPLSFLVIAVLEGSLTAIIADDSGALDAVKRATELVRANFWPYLILTMIVYFGSSILSSFIAIPVIIPAFIIPFVIGSGPQVNVALAVAVIAPFACAFALLLSAYTGVVTTFIKAALSLTYLKLQGKTLETSLPAPQKAA